MMTVPLITVFGATSKSNQAKQMLNMNSSSCNEEIWEFLTLDLFNKIIYHRCHCIHIAI